MTTDREMIEQAIAAGRVTVCPPRSKAKTHDPAPKVEWDEIERGSGKKPTPAVYRAPERLGVRELLEWAFATERASMDADEIAAVTGGVRSARGTEALIAERAELGNVKVDVSGGVSLPADEADVVASVLRNCLPWRDAVWVADLARARSTPQLLDHITPRFQPIAWTHGRGGPVGRKVNLIDQNHANAFGLPVRGGWHDGASRRRNRKGVVVVDPIECTPVTQTITAAMVARARRTYLDWWGLLLTFHAAIGGRVGRIEVTGKMPAMEPWKEGR